MPLTELLLVLFGCGAQTFLDDGYRHAKNAIRNHFHGQKSKKIREFLKGLGATTSGQIRNAVYEWNGRQDSPFSAADEEQLCSLLISITSGARFLTTQGTVRSSFVRSEQMLNLLLNGIETRFTSGDRVADGHEWCVERFLGMGSFGEVWMARNPGHPVLRAYKFFTQPDGKEWLRKEQANLFAITERLKNHPNVIQYEDVNVHANIPFLALEYAGGGSLEDWILENSESRARLNLSDAVKGLIAGTAEAHINDICHRDLKPSNIVLTEEIQAPQIKITDFGIARDVSTRSQEAYSQQSLMVGTPLYLPPEASIPGYEIDGFQCDVFAIGVIWYQLLTNSLERPPYDFAERLRHVTDSHTINLISRCLASPEHRFANAHKLSLELTEMIPVRPQAEIPQGIADVQHVFREYLSAKA